MLTRIEKVVKKLEENNCSAFIVTKPKNTYYLSNFQAIVYTRPIIVVVTTNGQPALIVPQLEYDHAKENSTIKDIYTYSDDQLGGIEGKSPLDLAIELAGSLLAGQKRIGFEAEGISYTVYQKLSRKFYEKLVPLSSVVEKLRLIKDEEEIKLIELGCQVADFGMEKQRDLTVEGISEIEIMVRGNAEMAVRASSLYPEMAVDVGSRPVSGDKSAVPHSMPTGKKIASGEVVIHGTGCLFNGYHSEDERTFIVSPATDKQKELYKITTEAQQRAINSIKAGIKCSEVDRLTKEIITKYGCGEGILHRTGHGIGLDEHELPFFAAGDETVLEAGMVMTVEPGIYFQQTGGFRHSDTVVVTETGCRVLTSFPKDLEEMILGN